jgi:phosphoglucomutase
MEEYLQKKFPNREVKAIQTPTGFKWIADLGNWGVEESNGVGNPYLREKDGIFSTFFLLKIMLHTGKTPRELMEETWNDFGRVYFTRGEVSGENESEKEELVAILDSADRDKGTRFGSLTLEGAEKWDYMHPETGELAARGAAWVLYFSEGNTVKARFSGTGSGGYTLRVYCSKYDREYDRAKSEITMPMKEAFNAFLQSRGFSGEAHSYTDAHQPDPYK